jgi:predicted acylesterase/phospholipase RssA
MDLQKQKPTGISFSAGGVLAIAQLGTLTALIESGMTTDVTDWYGCSGGCFAAICGAIRASSQWIRDSAYVCDMRFLGDIDDELVSGFLTSWGIVSGDRLLEMLGRIVETWEPRLTTLTFQQLPSLHIISTNLTRGCGTVFDSEHTPTVRIMDAVRASIAIPCFLTPWIDPVSGDIHCDGSVYEYYPWHSVKDKERTLVIMCSDKSPKSAQIHTFIEYVSRIVSMKLLLQTHDRPKHWITLQNIKIDSLNYRVTREERMELFEEGRLSAASISTSIETSETHGTSPFHEVRRISRGPLACLDKTSDIPQSCTLSRPEDLFQHPRTGSSQKRRRWSL